MIFLILKKNAYNSKFCKNLEIDKKMMDKIPDFINVNR